MFIKIKRAAAFLLTLPVFLCVCLSSCKTGSTEPDISESFGIVYDKMDKNTYTAVDIKQTPDEGYIILGMIGRAPYLLRLDNKGNYMWDTDADDFKNYLGDPDIGAGVAVDEDAIFSGYIGPAPGILILNGEYFFFCNESYENTEDSPLVLLKLSDGNHVPSLSKLPFENLYNKRIRPFKASLIPGNNILLVSLDLYAKKTRVLKMDLKNGEDEEYGNSTYCYYTYPFEDKKGWGFHIAGTIEISGNDYSYIQTYINSSIFRNSTMCFGIIKIAPPAIMAFEDNFSQDIQEPFNIKRPFIAMELDGSQWDGTSGWDGLRVSGAKIKDDIISFFVNIELKDVDVEMGGWGDQQSELIDSKPVFVKVTEVNSQHFVFFAGSSKDNRIVLYAYGREDGVSRDKKYFGHTHIYEAADLIETKDGGLAILGTTYVAGRLGRICLFKISKADLENMVDLTP